MNPKISLYSPPYREIQSYTQLIDLAAAKGITAVETVNMAELATPDLEAAKRLRRYADERGIKICCVSAGVNMVEDDFWNQIAIMKQYAEAAAILGSPYLHHTVAFEFSNYEKVRQNARLYYQRGLTAVRQVADHAQKLGIRCIYENQGYLFNGTQGLTRFLQDVERDVGLVADFGNIQFVDENAEDFIPHFPGRFYHAHVKDYVRSAPTPEQKQAAMPQLSRAGTLLTDCAFGEGCVDFVKSWQALKNAGFDGYVSLECPPLPGWQQEELLTHNLAFLEKVMK